MRGSVLSALLMGAITASPSLAGSNNTVDLLQVSTGQFGNTLTIDQSGADNSLVAGDRLALTPARQIGDANSGNITVSGDGGRVAFGQSGLGNDAVATVTGLGGLGAIEQVGRGNGASLTVESVSALFPSEGVIGQFGNRNTATLTVSGTNVRGTLLQTGSNNTNSLNVSGQDSSVVFSQFGNNLTAPSGEGVSVFTNAGNVSITQTNFGTLR